MNMMSEAKLKLFVLFVLSSTIESSGFECHSAWFDCGNGKCISEIWLCDGENDCGNLKDERDCEKPATQFHCLNSQFSCVSDNHCIPKTWQCDGKVDCDDGSDEHGCGMEVKACLENEFQCEVDGFCIVELLKCDGREDCNDGSDERNCSYYLLEAEPEFAEPINNVTVAIGRDAHLSCTVENLGTYRAAWIKVETKAILTIYHHIITRNYRISLSHSDNRNFILQIRNVQESDKGGYMCQVNTVPMKSQVGYLDVLVPPDILDEGSSSDVVVREGANVTLTCKAVGYPTPNITWRREDNEPIPLGAWQGKKFTDLNAVTYEGEILSISRVSRLHTGAYLCIAANGVPPSVSRRIILHVHFPPVLWIPNQLVGAPLGRDVTLDCHTEAYPSSINYWGRRPNEMIISNEKMQVITKEKTYKTHMRLIIKNLQPQDFGVYTCFSKNSLGATEGTVNLYEIQLSTSPPTKDTSAVRRQSSDAFPQHQSLGSVKDSTEDTTAGKKKRPLLIDGAYRTNEHINTVEDMRKKKPNDISQLKKENEEETSGQSRHQITWILLFLSLTLFLRQNCGFDVTT